MSEMSNNLAALAVLVETAEKHALPMPFVVSATAYDARVQVEMNELHIWTEWLGSDVASEGHENGPEIFHRTEADFGGSRVTFTAIEHVTEVVKA